MRRSITCTKAKVSAPLWFSKMKILKKHRAFDGDVHFCEHESSSTQTKMRFSTYRPDSLKKPRGLLIWLSGLTCTEENFMAKAGAFKALSESGMMILCPDTSPRGLDLPHETESWDFGRGASFYLDATTPGYRDHYRMESYVTKDLPLLIENEFGLRDKMTIAGHSMGGHGALVLGLRHPELFKCISAFAPISNPTLCPWGEKAFGGYLGPDRNSWKPFDATELIKSGHRHSKEILIDQGGADEFLETQLLPLHLLAAIDETSVLTSVPPQKLKLRMQAGYDHSYYFITSFIAEHIRHHAQQI